MRCRHDYSNYITTMKECVRHWKVKLQAGAINRLVGSEILSRDCGLVRQNTQVRLTNNTGIQLNQTHHQVSATSISESLSPTSDSSNIPLPPKQYPISRLHPLHLGINGFPKRQTPFFNHPS